MSEIYYGKIIDVLPSSVTMRVSSNDGTEPIFRKFDSTPLLNVVEIKTGTVVKITVDQVPGNVNVKYEPAAKEMFVE